MSPKWHGKINRQYTYIVGKYKIYLYELQKQEEKLKPLAPFYFLFQGEYK
jgi:hypothetical protein